MEKEPEVRTKSGIGAWLAQPENRAGLLQASLSLLQPSYGGTLSNLGRAIGEGAEARDRSIIQNSKLDDVEADNELQSRRVDNETRRLDATIGAKGSKGPTLSQIMQGQRAEQSAFLNYLQIQAKAKAAEGFTDENEELAAIMDDPVRLAEARAKFREFQGANTTPGIAPAVAPAAPSAAAGPSEADIQFTMQKHNLTREQVMQRLGK
jgi:hypothetical protein